MSDKNCKRTERSILIEQMTMKVIHLKSSIISSLARYFAITEQRGSFAHKLFSSEKT